MQANPIIPLFYQANHPPIFTIYNRLKRFYKYRFYFKFDPHSNQSQTGNNLLSLGIILRALYLCNQYVSVGYLTQPAKPGEAAKEKILPYFFFFK